MPLSNDSLKPFLNTLPVVLYEFLQHEDGSGEVLYVSPNSNSILGYPSEYFIEDKSLKWEFIHPDDLKKFRDKSVNTIYDDFFSISVRIILPSGEIRWVRFRSKPEIKRNSGDILWAGCIVDITDLKEANEEIKLLQGIIPICSYCKNIRDDEGYWKSVEEYISSRTSTEFTHGICDACMKKHFPKIYDKKDHDQSDGTTVKS